jgi:hypothetical protein
MGASGKGCLGFTEAMLPEYKSGAHTLALEGVYDDR